MDGILGYELDSTKLTKEEKQICREQVKAYKKNYPLIVCGDYYRLTNPYTFSEYVAWEHVSPDQREALVSLVTGSARAAQPFTVLRLKGLDPQRRYRITGTDGLYGSDTLYRGDTLMYAGYPIPLLWGDYQSVQLYLEAVE